MIPIMSHEIQELSKFEIDRLNIFHKFVIFLQDGGLGNHRGNMPMILLSEPVISQKIFSSGLFSSVVGNVEIRTEYVNPKYGFMIHHDKYLRVGFGLLYGEVYDGFNEVTLCDTEESFNKYAIYISYKLDEFIRRSESEIK